MRPFRKHILITCLLLTAFLPACTPTPTPAPAFIPIPTDLPSRTKEPCIDISASATTLKVGESATITGIANKVESTYFFGLQIKDLRADDFSMLVNLPASGAPQPADVSQVLKFVSAENIDHGRSVVLRADQVGSTKVAFFISGNAACADPSKGGATSEIIDITVNP